MEDSDDKKPWSNTIEWEYESARQREKIFTQTIEYFAQNKEAQEYFQQFQPSSAESQLKSYAWRKARWLVDKPNTEWCLEYTGLETPLAAQTCLGNIQQKKLFDKQCLWRAEMFKHPEIETTTDFIYWEHNILNCPFIDPITEDDIALYIEFLHEYLGENLTFLGGWQDYNTYNSSHTTIAKMVQNDENENDMENDEDEYEDGEDTNEDYEDEDYDEEDDDVEEGSLMPPWYIFVNQRRNDGHYLLLPDKRQEKEWFYGRIGQKEINETAAKNHKINSPDVRPFLSLFQNDNIEVFINDFEPNADEILNAFHVHEKFYNDPEEEKMYWVKEAWEQLKDCFEPFPIAAGITDWKKALIKTASQWKNTKIARILPVHYDEYLFRRASGIANPCNADQVATYRRMADNNKKTIIRGRELSGEPADLNF